MSERPWIESIPEDDLDIYRLAGFANSVGLGSRPGVVVIDVQYRTAGDEPLPIRRAIAEWYPTACGDRAWDVIPNIARVIKAARSAGAPVLFPCVAPKKAVDAGRFGEIMPGVTSIPERGYEFVEEVAPIEGEVVIPKRHASAFFGTALASYLIDFGLDTLIVTGATTSGCVRATVADAFSYNFRTIVVADGVYDRLQVSHDVSLFDMDAKYADVVTTDEIVDYLEGIESRSR